MNNPQIPSARQKGLVVQEMPDEVLVYDLDSNKAHCLNRSAAFVWKSCDGNNSIPDIVMAYESKIGAKVTEDFVWLAIDQLSEKGLLEVKVATRFAGQSRRQVLKTIGLASVVALPVIASLVAPPNAMALTSCSCTGNNDCNPATNPGVNCPAITCNASNLCLP